MLIPEKYTVMRKGVFRGIKVSEETEVQLLPSCQLICVPVMYLELSSSFFSARLMPETFSAPSINFAETFSSVPEASLLASGAKLAI